MKMTLRTKDIIKRTEIGRETLRFYERIGLLRRPKKSSSGYREYTVGDIQKIKFIKMAQQVGFTLREIKQFLNLSGRRKPTRELIKQNIADKLLSVSAKIENLNKIKGTLEDLKRQAELEENNSILCPILGEIDLYTEE